MRIEHIELKTIETGLFKLDGGAMFGTVPKPLWEKAIQPDEQNRIPMALRLFLIRDLNSKRNLLIDTGIGSKWSDKLKKIYGIDHSEFSLERGLAGLGLSKSDISDVILTHLHFDHAGGATSFSDDQSQIIPTFPKAKYYIQKANWDCANDSNSRESASYLKENYLPLLESKQIEICDGAQDFQNRIQFPGMNVFISTGHTTGLQCPIFKVGGSTFFYPADLIPTSHHLPVPWVMGYDVHVLQILKEKENILSQAVEEKWNLIYEHDPLVPASTVVQGAKHFQRGDIITL